MASRMLVTITRGPEDPDRVTVAFVMANAALSLERRVVVLLSSEGVRLGERRVLEAVAEPGLPPLADLVRTFLEGGGEIWACMPCVEKRRLNDALLPEIRKVGAVAAMEFVLDDGVALSF